MASKFNAFQDKLGRFIEGNPGRQPGSPNKFTKEVKAAYLMLLHNNMQQYEDWLVQVAEDDPARALDIVIRFTDFVLPRLQRTTMAGDEESPLEIKDARQELIKKVTSIDATNGTEESNGHPK